LLPLGVKQVMISGEKDGVMPQAVREAWIAKSRAAGDDATLLVVPDGHFEYLAPGTDAGAIVRRTIAELLRAR
jgi:hypothetical protein